MPINRNGTTVEPATPTSINLRSDAPGTILADCSLLFRERFDRATLVIAKGQGNYETLSGTPARIVFLLKVKCPLVAGEVGLPVGTHALFYQERAVSRR